MLTANQRSLAIVRRRSTVDDELDLGKAKLAVLTSHSVESLLARTDESDSFSKFEL
jgi:hypothetical protein